MILLDTHVVLWLISGSTHLGRGAAGKIQDAWGRGDAKVSSFTFWEIGLLHARDRLGLDYPPGVLRRRLVFDGIDTVPVDDSIALRAAELEHEGFHRDPADRIITATAIVNGFRLATSDRLISAWAERSGKVAILDPEC